MRKILIFILVASITITLVLFLYQSEDKGPIPDRAPIDGSTLPDRAMKAVCILGRPILVALLDAKLDSRIVIFPGPVKESWHESAKVFNYAGYYVSHPPNEFADAITLLDALEEYRPHAMPEALAHYQLLKIDALPEALPEAVELLGPWDTLIHRANPKRERMVWRRDMCIGDKLIHGLWVEAIDDRIIESRGIADPEKLERML